MVVQSIYQLVSLSTISNFGWSRSRNPNDSNLNRGIWSEYTANLLFNKSFLTGPKLPYVTFNRIYQIWHTFRTLFSLHHAHCCYVIACAFCVCCCQLPKRVLLAKEEKKHLFNILLSTFWSTLLSIFILLVRFIWFDAETTLSDFLHLPASFSSYIQSIVNFTFFGKFLLSLIKKFLLRHLYIWFLRRKFIWTIWQHNSIRLGLNTILTWMESNRSA